MKKLLISTVFTLVSATAFADHSLTNAMQDSKAVKAAVTAAANARGVVCDTDQSIQIQVSNNNTKWRQVALCYKDKATMEKARAEVKNPDGLGIYGLPVEATLDVTYSFVNYGAKDVLEIVLK